MKLIDADALIDKTDDRYSLGEIGRRERDDIVNALEYAPTITAQPKTGKWIPLQLSMANPPYQCSCCLKNAPMVETGCLVNRYFEALLTDYCPNCGCRMLKEGEQE